MFEDMAKLEIVGHRRHLDATLACVQRRAVVQLLDATSVPGLNIAPLAADEQHLRAGEQLRRLRTSLDALLALGPVPAAGAPAEFSAADLRAVWAELEELAPLVEPLVARLDALEAEQSTLPRHMESLRRLVPLVPDVPELEAYETVALLVESRHAVVVGWLRDELAALLDNRFEIISAQVEPNTIGAVLVFPRADSRRVHSLLAQQQVSRVRLPDRFHGMALAPAIAAMERRMADLPTEVAATRASLLELLGSRSHWHDARAYIDRRLAQLDAARAVGTT